MKSGARIAMGVAAGYLLGRTRKMRLALMVAAAGATGSSGISPRMLLKRVVDQVGSVPEVAKLADTARGELLNAAKAAAVTAASNRITSLSDRMQDQITGGSKGHAEDDEESDEGELPRDDDEQDGQERSGRRSARRGRAGAEDEDSDSEDEEDDSEDADEPVTPRRRTGTQARAGTGRSPVRRGGR